MDDGNKFEAEDSEYYMSSRRLMTVYHRSSDTRENVSLDTPYWPLSIFTYWLIFAGGIGLWFFSFGWKMIKNRTNNNSTSS